ncbi:MAG: hypothetical protein R3A52_18575 [Polyangiales bacterium]
MAERRSAESAVRRMKGGALARVDVSLKGASRLVPGLKSGAGLTLCASRGEGFTGARLASNGLDTMAGEVSDTMAGDVLDTMEQR